MAASSGLLAGRIALVTGGGSGIGRAVCQVFSREGARLVVADRNEEAAESTIENLPGGAGDHIAVALDVSVAQSVHAVIKQAISKYSKPPSVVVNSAGITRDNFLLKMDEDSFQSVIDTNLRGTFLVMHASANAMVDAKIDNGSIINIASVSGKHGNVGQCNYAASKAGVEALTKTASKELGKLGIRCNAVLPGFIDTPMTTAVPDKVKEKIVSMIPVGRFGLPEEVAEVILFLASEKSSYMTGACVDVTGGLTL